MAFVNHVTTALPEYLLDQDKVREIGRALLKGKVPFLDQALNLFNNAGVRTRYLIRDVDEILANESLGWRNRVYTEGCIEMGTRLMTDLLAATGLQPTDIDLLITTSCTGFMIPSVDAYLINHFRMRRDTKRLPITELGCAAGAMALSRANEYLLAHPDQRVVVISLELPSLTCQGKDFRMANVVSAALFGDGGAAALLSNQPSACRILRNQTHFYYDSPELMGFELDEKGFRILLDKRIKDVVLNDFLEPVRAFLAAQDLTPGDIRHFVFHPGGRRIMDNLKQILNLCETDIAASRKVLAEVGNLSSASVFWVLAEVLAKQPEGLGLMAAFGPGFNAELLTMAFTQSPDGAGDPIHTH